MKGLESPVKKRARLSLKRREPASEKISPPLLTNLSGGKCKASVDSTSCPATSAAQSDGIDNVVTTSTAHAVASMVTSLPRNSSMTNASEAENSWEPSRSKVNSTADVGNDVISINSDDVYESMPIVAALENLDNTCFLNSVLQILRYTPCFVDGLNELCYKVAKHTRSFADSSVESESSRVWELALSISEVFKQMSALERKMQGLSSVTSANIALKPDRVQNVVRKLNSMFEGSSQHDAQEFLQFILYHLQEAEKLLKKASASEANNSSHSNNSSSGNTRSSNSRSNSSSNFNGTASPVSLSPSSENISTTSGTLSTDNSSAFVGNKTMVNNSESSCDGLHLLPPTEIALSPNCSISPDVIVRSYSLDDLSSTLHTSSSSSQKTSESALTDQCPATHQLDKTSDFKTNLLKHQCVSSLDDANSVSELGTSTLTKLQPGFDSSSHNSHTNGISSVGGTRIFSAEDTKLSSTEDSKSASVEDVKSSSVVDKKSTSVKDKKCVSEEGSKSASVEGVKHVSVVDSKCASLKDTNCISMEYTNCTSEDDTKCIIVEDKKSTFKKDRDCILSRDMKFVQVDDTQDIYMEDMSYRSSISDKKLVPVENLKSSTLDNMKDNSALKEVMKPTCEIDAKQVRGEDMLLKTSSSSSSFILTPPLTPLSAKCFTIEAAVTNGKIGVNGPLSVAQYSSKATHPTPLLSQSQASPSSSAPVPHCHSASAPLPPSTLSPCLSPPPPLLENSCHSPENCPTIQTTVSVTATDNTINSATTTTTTTATITTTSTNTNTTNTNTANTTTTTTTTTTTANANSNNNNSHTYNKNSNNKKTKSKNTVSLHNGMSKNQVRQIWNSFVKLEKCDLVCNSALSSVNVYYAIECLNTGNSLKKKKDFVKQLFLGTILSRTRCLECEKSSEKPEEFLEVSVPLKKTSNPLRNSDGESSDPENEDSSDQNTLISFISSFSEVEKLQGDNKYYCDSCYNYVEADRSLHYDTLPDILTVHLKRFSASSEIGLMCKINDHVDIPLSLPCLLYKCPKDCYRQDHRYSLFGMITHAGYTISSGHYVAYVKTFAGSLTWHFPPNGGQRDSMPVNSAASCRSSYSDSHSDGDIFWLECDDSSVRVFTEEDFLERLSSEGLLTGTPYLLFYHRSPMKRS